MPSPTTEITTPAAPTTVDVAAQVLAWMGAQSGVVTDYNAGSQIRTWAEALGSTVEIQSVIAQALAFQAIVYGAYAAFQVYPLGATSSVGTVTFATSLAANAPTATQPVFIPQGTLCQTTGGIQFQTTANATLSAGSVSVNVPVAAVVTGAQGNVPAGTITQLVSSLTSPLQITNALPTTGGTNAETAQQTLARFTAKVAAIGTGSPIVIANAVIGVQNPGTTETVMYSTVYEPWVTEQTSTSPGPSVYNVYIDNGSGGASSGLIAAVTAQLNGSASAGTVGYRPAGVPYYVYAVTPVDAVVTITGTLISSQYNTAATAAVVAAVNQYFQGIQFGQTVQQNNINAVVANNVGGYLVSFNVVLSLNGTSVSQITAGNGERVILQTLNVTFT